MPRLVEMILPESNMNELIDILREQKPISLWVQSLSGLWLYPEDGGEAHSIEEMVLIRILLHEKGIEELLDTLEKRFSESEGFRINLMTLAATVPLPGAMEAPQAKPPENEEADERISRQELYEKVEDDARTSKSYLAFITLSSIVAAIGLLGNNSVVIIGSMVIAPILGPIMALCLAITLADRSLARDALKSGITGLAIAVVLSAAIGYFFHVSPGNSEIDSRLSVNLVDIVLALASGSAGALAITTGLNGALIGVAISASLIPPLVIFGLMLGSGDFILALSALLLFLVNIICINLSGIAAFVIQGIRPSTWREAKRAKRETRIAIALWTFLVIVLAAIIWISKGGIDQGLIHRVLPFL
jgi:uncharacterized hydrophobic protein (TIGR00341 family)